MLSNEFDKKLGLQIKALRIEKGYTQEQLARMVGYSSKDSISKIERGAFQIDLPRAEKIAKALNVRVTDFMTSFNDSNVLLESNPKVTVNLVEDKSKIKFAGYFEHPQDYLIVNEVQQGLTTLTAEQMKQVNNFIKAIKG